MEINWLTIISIITTLIATLVIVWKAIRLTGGEQKGQLAAVLLKYEEALKMQIDRMEDEKASWLTEKQELMASIAKLSCQVLEMRVSIDNLTAQVKSLGGVPEFYTHKRKSDKLDKE